MTKINNILTSNNKKNVNEPTFTMDLSEHGQIINIEFSVYEWSQDLFLVGFENKILLGLIEYKDNISVSVLSEFKHPCRCTSLNISPQSSLNVLPNLVVFCTAANDFKLRIFRSDLLEDNTCKVLSGHTNYINDCKFDTDNAFLASTGDDNTLKIWEVESGNLNYSFDLSSPGVSVCWHRSEASKLMVAEKMGVIRFYNVETKTAILSLDNGSPVANAHWSPDDNQLVGTLQLGELCLWELTNPCLPIFSTLLFSENGGQIRFSSRGEYLAAVNNLDGTLKIIHMETRNPKLSVPVSLPTNVAWYYRLPMVCLGDDTKLKFFSIK